MGRAHLSTQYGLDDAPCRRSPCIQEPPKWIDAPYDLDAAVGGPDEVYEAFLADGEQFERPPSVVAAPVLSRIQYADSDEASDVTTLPSTRVPSPVRRDEDGSDTTVDRGSRVLELLEPLANARAAAHPAIQAALADSNAGLRPLVLRLVQILRPHITLALAPFTDIPEVEFLGNMFERSLVLDVLSPPGSGSPARYTSSDILSALDAAEETLYVQPVEDTLGADPTSQMEPISGEETQPTEVEDIWWIRTAESTSSTPNRYAPRVIPGRVSTPSDNGTSSTTSSVSNSRAPSPQAPPRVFRARDARRDVVIQTAQGYHPFLATPRYVNPEPLR